MLRLVPERGDVGADRSAAEVVERAGGGAGRDCGDRLLQPRQDRHPFRLPADAEPDAGGDGLRQGGMQVCGERFRRRSGSERAGSPSKSITTQSPSGVQSTWQRW